MADRQTGGAMERKVIGVGVGLSMLGAGCSVLLAWLVYGWALTAQGLAMWFTALACGFPLGCVGLFFLGFWMGKTEVRGFLGGVDASLDKLTATINARDSAAIAARSRATGGDKTPVTIVQAEPARFRVRSSQDDVIDL